MKKLPRLRTGRGLWLYAKRNGPVKTARVLRLYVQKDQPDSFMPMYTTRAMCHYAALGLEGIPLASVDWGRWFYIDTKYGWWLYYCMWTSGRMPSYKETK